MGWVGRQKYKSFSCNSLNRMEKKNMTKAHLMWALFKQILQLQNLEFMVKLANKLIKADFENTSLSMTLSHQRKHVLF